MPAAPADREATGAAWASIRATNDPAAWARFVALVRPRMLAFAAARLGDWDEAEDAVQEALAALLDKRESVTGDGAGWLRGAVRNETLDFRRRVRNDAARRISTDLAADTLEDPADDPLAALLRSELASVLLDGLDEVAEQSPARRAMLDRRYEDGETAEAIAAALGTTAGTVKTAIQLARRVVADRAAEHDDRRYDAEATLARWRAARAALVDGAAIDGMLADAARERERAEHGWMIYYTFWRRVGAGRPPERIMLPRGAKKPPRSLAMARRHVAAHVARYPAEEILVVAVSQGRGRHRGRWYRTAVERHSWHKTTAIREPVRPLHELSTPALSRRPPSIPGWAETHLRL